MTPAVRIDGQLAVVEFSRFDLESYRLFLACKQLPESRVSYAWKSDRYTLTTPSRFADRLGAAHLSQKAAAIPLAPYLRDYQAWIVRDLILPARRFAAWIDTGLGKTAIILETARQVVALTGGRYLILQPPGIHSQTVEMAASFYGANLTVERLPTRAGLIAWCQQPGTGIGLASYHTLVDGEIGEFRHLAGLAADESSLLRTGGGVIKWNLIHSAKGVEYKLSATATPAPNEAMEYASQASFLETMRTEGEILWTYFERDKHDVWVVKPHARQAFYEFMASWSVYMRDPSRFGFEDILSTLPPPDVREYELPLTDVQRETMYGLIGKKAGLFNDDRLTLSERSKLAQLARGFLYRTDGGKRRAVRYPSAKPELAAELVAADVADGRQVIVWTVFDEEGEIVAEHLPPGVEHATLSGSQSDAERADLVARFKRGDVPVLISKPSLIGYGLNLQMCGSMVFSGFDDSFEREYQAVRRAVRPGQQRRVRVHYPHIPELEGTVFANIRRKQARFDEETAMQEEHYRRVLLGGDSVIDLRDDLLIWNEDCISGMATRLAPDSVGHVVTSIPFSNLFMYSGKNEDVGNSWDPGTDSRESHFGLHLRFWVEQVHRVLQSGRILAIHVQQLVATKVQHGYMGRRNFRDATIALVERDPERPEDRRFDFVGEVVIPKNPQRIAQAQKLHSLLFVTGMRDGCRLAPAVNDYVLLFRKPGEDANPVRCLFDAQKNPDGWVTRNDWIRYARGVWDDIQETDVLEGWKGAREEGDEKHVCPLQLEVPRRTIRLYSNPGDVVLDPFAGIGTVQYVALEQGRRTVGFELKESYYRQALKNAAKARRERADEASTVLELFSALEEAAG